MSDGRAAGRLDIDLSAQVWTADGHMIGLAAGVVLDPGDKTVTHLVVRYGLIVTVERVVPAGAILKAQDDEVRLALTAHELGEAPELQEHAYLPLGGVDIGTEERPAVSAPGLWTRTPAIAIPPLVSDHTSDQANIVEEWRNVPEGSVVLREGLPVRTQDGRRVGSLKEVTAEPDTGALTGLAVTVGDHVKAVPAAWIERNDEETGIVLSVDRRAVAELPSER